MALEEVPVPLADIVALTLPELQFLAFGHDPKQKVPLNSSKHGMQRRRQEFST